MVLREVFRERRMWGPRKARVRVGEPIDLRDHLDAYREQRRDTTRDVTLALETSARTMLEALAADCRTVDPT